MENLRPSSPEVRTDMSWTSTYQISRSKSNHLRLLKTLSKKLIKIVRSNLAMWLKCQLLCSRISRSNLRLQARRVQTVMNRIQILQMMQLKSVRNNKILLLSRVKIRNRKKMIPKMKIAMPLTKMNVRPSRVCPMV